MRIFVISLIRSENRRQLISEKMRNIGIEFEFFDAIDGRMENPIFSDYDYKKCLWLTSGKFPTRGEMGCYASHYMLWIKCLENNEPLIVLEDDCIILETFSKHLKDIRKLVDEYHFIRLQDTIRGRVHPVENKVNYSVSLMEDNFGGAVGYAISPSAAAKLIKHRWSLPVDCFIGRSFLHGMNSFVFSPALVAPDYSSPTTVQLDTNRASWYRKLTRELYSLYKKIRIKWAYITTVKGMEK